MRHAHAQDRGPTDFDRPLSERGRAEAGAVGTRLAAANRTPDVILASAALRTRTTAELVAARLPGAPPVQALQDLYGAPPEDLRAALTTCGNAATVLLIAHNPGVADWMQELGGAPIRCPPATCEAFEFDLADWAELTATTPARGVET